jgi:hypothetical protein
MASATTGAAKGSGRGGGAAGKTGTLAMVVVMRPDDDLLLLPPRGAGDGTHAGFFAVAGGTWGQKCQYDKE